MTIEADFDGKCTDCGRTDRVLWQLPRFGNVPLCDVCIAVRDVEEVRRKQDEKEKGMKDEAH